MEIKFDKRKVVEGTAASMLATVGFVMAIVGTVKSNYKKTVVGLTIGTIFSAVTTEIYSDAINSFEFTE